MAQVRIRRVTLQAFRGFVERQSTSLLPEKGLVGVRGLVKENGGSSGAGKSSVAYAIAYAFGFLPFPANQQQNWTTKLPMQVELELDTDKGPAILKRGKEFSLKVGDKAFSGAAKAVEEEIQKLVGVPTPLLEALTYRQQQKRGRFLSMTDAEKKEFLGTLLGSEEIEQQISNSTKSANLLMAEVDKLNAACSVLEKAVVRPIAPAFRDEGPLKAQLQAARASPVPKPPPAFVPPESKLSDLQGKLEEVNRRISAQTDVKESKRKELRDSAALKAAEVQRFRDEASRKAGLLIQISKIESDVKKLAESKCPTCFREWEESEQKLLDAEVSIRQLTAQAAECDKSRATAEALQKESDALYAQFASYRNEILDKLVGIREIVEREIAIEKSSMASTKGIHDSLVRLYQTEMRARESAIEAAQAQLASTKAANEQLAAQYADALKHYERNSSSLREKQEDRDQKLKKANEELDYAAALKGYLGSLFDEVLLQISNETNDLLKSIPNTPTTTISFASETLTQKGVAKQEIKPVVSKNGQQIDLKSGISGGQLESVELAVDLSIAKVIGQRTGVRPGFMIFDESFSAHCLPVKEACLQVLQKAAEDCLILVIDHATELKEYFTQFIDVESERDVSRLVVL